jgi:hypothetical protein
VSSAAKHFPVLMPFVAKRKTAATQIRWMGMTAGPPRRAGCEIPGWRN